MAKLQVVENRTQYLEGQVQGLHINYHNLQNTRTLDLQRQEVTDQYIRHLEHNLQVYKRKVEVMGYEYNTSMERVQTAIWEYPNEFGQFRCSISRARVIAITEDECVSVNIASCEGAE